MPTSAAAFTSISRSDRSAPSVKYRSISRCFICGALPDGLRPQDQPVAVERVGLPLHLVDRVGETLFGGRRGDAAGNALVALGRAELGGEVFVPAHAFARHPWIEEIGVVAHFNRNIRLERQRLLKTSFSDEAPRANHVGNDVDRQAVYGLGRAWRPRESVPARLSRPITRRQPCAVRSGPSR